MVVEGEKAMRRGARSQVMKAVSKAGKDKEADSSSDPPE